MSRTGWATGKPKPLDREARLLLLCARLCLDDAAREDVEATVRGGVDWDVILDRSHREGVQALLFTHLKDLARLAPHVPARVRARLQTSYHRNWARNAVLTDRWAEVTAALAREGVEAITHKGLALMHTVYPDIGLRPMADIDLLIRRRDLPAAAQALAATGYRTASESMQAEEAFRHYRHFVRDSTVIDLHWELANYARFERVVRIDDDTLWKGARHLAVGEAHGLMLSPEDSLLHLALHLTLGSEFGRLIWFTDIDCLVRRFGPDVKWERAIEKAARWRVGVLLGFTLQICRESFGTPVPDWVLGRLSPGRFRLVLLNACIGTLRPPSLAGPVGDSRLYFGETLLMDRLRDVCRVLWWSLFPSRSWLQFHYGVSVPWKISLRRALHPFRVFYLAAKHLR